MNTAIYIKNLINTINNSNEETYTTQTILYWLKEIERLSTNNNNFINNEYQVDYNCPDRNKFIESAERSLF